MDRDQDVEVELYEENVGSRYNRGFYRHRIANFPNYVTLTSSLTHHRIVNLGAHGATGTYVSFRPRGAPA